MQLVVWAFFFAAASAGRSIAAKMAMMAMTTSNSIRVKARLNLPAFGGIEFDCFMVFSGCEPVDLTSCFLCKNHSLCQNYCKDYRVFSGQKKSYDLMT